ncbi:MAG TPA: beta-propeller fold lactonase family protein [Candidatus Polarisedimenticolaceae bacterium]|nr:beta-propeller fold lactonase family protein [Candidatus Polarisedimenticolaceae bacterium]
MIRLAVLLLLGPAVAAGATGCTSRSHAEQALHLYVSNEVSGDISVYDAQTLRPLRRIDVGKRPRGLRLSPDGSLLYVAVSGSPREPPGTDPSTLPPPDRRADGIAVVDPARGRVLRILESGTDPESFALSPDGKWLCVSNEDAAQASFVDLATGKVVAQVPVGGEPEGVAVHPNGSVVYVTSEEENQVVVLDADRHVEVARFSTGPRPRGIAFTPGGARAFITNENGASLTVADAWKHRALGTIPLGEGARPMGAVVSGDGQRLYVSLGRGGGVAVVDVPTLTVVRRLDGVGARPWGIALTPDGTRLFTANGPGNDVTVLELPEGRERRKLPAGESPWGIALGVAP